MVLLGSGPDSVFRARAVNAGLIPHFRIRYLRLAWAHSPAIRRVWEDALATRIESCRGSIEKVKETRGIWQRMIPYQGNVLERFGMYKNDLANSSCNFTFLRFQVHDRGSRSTGST